MTRDYYGTKRVTAWPQEKDGQPGYAVKYDDGYVSWSPQAVFDAAYQTIESMSFGHALVALKAGHTVARSNWNGKGMWLERQVPDENSKMKLPYISIVTIDGRAVPWVASQSDMEVEDWYILPV